MIIENDFTEEEIEQICGDCAYYWECHKKGFDLDIAKDCDNIKYTEIDDDICEQQYKVICETLGEQYEP